MGRTSANDGYTAHGHHCSYPLFFNRATAYDLIGAGEVEDHSALEHIQSRLTSKRRPAGGGAFGTRSEIVSLSWQALTLFPNRRRWRCASLSHHRRVFNLWSAILIPW